MKTASFRCAACGLLLTQPLQLLTDTTLLSEEDGTDYVPNGFYMAETDEGYYTTGAGNYVVNLKSLQNTKPHPNGSRRNGCCGMDGLDGLNVVCQNGHEVGTEKSDCWMVHSLIFEPTAVVLELT